MAPVAGFQGKLGIGASSPVDLPLDFLSESLVCNENFIDRAGLRGTRSHPIEVTRVGLRRIEGQITMQPNAQEWAYLLPWILGTAASGTTYALAETSLERYVGIKRDDGTDGKYFEYNGVKVNRATIRCQQGEPLSCVLDLVGKDETVSSAGAGPSLTLDTATGPFTFSDSSGAISIGGSAYETKSMEIVIDNKLDTERFFNSNTRTAVIAHDREIMINLEVSYGDAEALYNVGIGGSAVSITFTNSTVSMLLSFVKVQFPRQSPSIPGKQEILLPLRGKAFQSSSTKELVVTLDSSV